MKISKKFLTIMVAVFLLTTMLTPALAATADTSVEAGDNVIVYFTYTEIYSIDGQFSVNDPNGIISSVDYRIASNGGMTGGAINGNTVFMFDTENPAKARTVQLCAVVKLKSNAAADKTCTINFAYNICKDETGQDVISGTDAATVKVKAAATSDPTEPPQPTKPVVKTDYSELERQISIATGLNEADYTADSWKTMADALAAAKNALNSKEQSKVDNAAKTLSDAINALIRMDYSNLQAVIEQVNTITDDQGFNNLFQDLLERLEAAKAALQSRDQAEVDTATNALMQAMEAFAAAIDKLKEVEIQTVEKEVFVEVYPDDPFCNITWHKIAQILLIVSAILNVVFVAIFILAVVKKKKNQKDNTPLVDYDIDDDE